MNTVMNTMINSIVGMLLLVSQSRCQGTSYNFANSSSRPWHGMMGMACWGWIVRRSSGCTFIVITPMNQFVGEVCDYVIMLLLCYYHVIMLLCYYYVVDSVDLLK